jgi:ubiquinone/menaquinone biosynthesis C-methylase UbiE
MVKLTTARRLWPFHRRKIAIREQTTPLATPPALPERDPLAPTPPANPISAFWASGRVPANVNEWLDRAAKVMQIGKERSFQVLQLAEGSSILDVGCGNGRDVIRLMEIVGHTGEVWGVDNSTHLIQEARKTYPQAKFMEGDIFKLPFKDHFFNAVRVERALMHTGDIARALGEMQRVTKPGGMLSAFEPVDAYWYPGNITLHGRVMEYCYQKFFRAGRAGHDAFMQMKAMGLTPQIECYTAMFPAELMRIEMTRPTTSSMYNFFRPATIQMAIEAGVITEAEGEEYLADFERSLEENSLLFCLPALLVYAQVPL